jgi:hypothetical protein
MTLERSTKKFLMSLGIVQFSDTSIAQVTKVKISRETYNRIPKPRATRKSISRKRQKENANNQNELKELESLVRVFSVDEHV